ncbi:unnamed protein product [Phytophthora fragariaefolia]|uniref:Cap-specific mRNA (nucleoside-2'-O-)-methyltransferase 1 n=1 Tax=Phytophthora fragariaefolia TaxID=1490495 RepID=A0A9W6Y956_9STRA|nr:unnamed protein product [Phytophthora fragariaefolia]
MSGEEEMMAAMGFTSFGRPRRERYRGKHAGDTKTTTVLPQLMPGTELEVQRMGCSTGSVENGPHGVVYLLCKETGMGELDAALSSIIRQHINDEQIEVPYTALLDELEREKQKFDKLENSSFLKARAATNLFEKLGRHRFLNRSAMKLVTLDFVFKWTKRLGQRQVALSFADICGGPGGFSEYLLWRDGESLDDDSKRVNCIRGYGITLKGAANNCDWRLPSELCSKFETCYGEDGTGNLYSIANIHSFRSVVRTKYPNGVDLVVADGGFLDARSQSNQRYIVARNLRSTDATEKVVGALEIMLIGSSSNGTADDHLVPNREHMLKNVDFLQYMNTANEAITRAQVKACRRINDYVANKNKRYAIFFPPPHARFDMNICLLQKNT